MEKIKAGNNAIEQAKLNDMHDQAEKQDLQRVVNQLLTERNDLFNKLEHLTSRYDECVRDISSDRAEMEKHNKQHEKLLTAKILFQILDATQKN